MVTSNSLNITGLLLKINFHLKMWNLIYAKSLNLSSDGCVGYEMQLQDYVFILNILYLNFLMVAESTESLFIFLIVYPLNTFLRRLRDCFKHSNNQEVSFVLLGYHKWVNYNPVLFHLFCFQRSTVDVRLYLSVSQCVNFGLFTHFAFESQCFIRFQNN